MGNWMGVELRHLLALAAIEEEGSFRGAAERLGYVQSAVSRQIAQLEQLVGTLLVERDRSSMRPAALTPSGRLLLRHGQRILSQFDAAEADLRALCDAGGVRLRVGVVQGVAARLLPAALADLRTTADAIAVEVEEAVSDRDLFAAVGTGVLDIAFAELPFEPGPFAGVEVLADPCVLVVPATSERAHAGPPAALEDLVALPLVRQLGWPTFELIERQLGASGVRADISLQANGAAAVQALVGAGCGAAILPRLAVQEDDPLVVVLPVGELLAPTRLALYWHEDRKERGALDRFVAAALDAADQLVAQRDAHLAASVCD